MMAKENRERLSSNDRAKRKESVTLKPRPLYIKLSNFDLQKILRLQGQALENLGCDRKTRSGFPEELFCCYWFDDRKPVLRCKSADRLLFLVPACPYAIMRQNPGKAPWEIAGDGQNENGEDC
jgi:hypothetical protein